MNNDSTSGTVGRKHPLFALTMGDPAGIGPEIALKAFKNQRFMSNVVVVGDRSVLQQAETVVRCGVPFHAITQVADFEEGAINIFDCRQLHEGAYVMGQVQAICGKAAFIYIDTAIAMALNGIVDGVITNPINKEALHAAGFVYPGHTEIFAEKTGTNHYSMLFLLNNVGVAHVTTHCSLRKAIEAIRTEPILSHIRLLNTTMRRLGITAPRIAVGGLNPHAGENGIFGDEEILHIAPAVAAARLEGINATGPHPPDTVFMRAFKGEFDGVVAMLHDHGFVALKSMDFDHGVNITIGLPIIRTSVGHGTAFDVAGQGSASPESLLSAFEAAVRLYRSGIDT